MVKNVIIFIIWDKGVVTTKTTGTSQVLTSIFHFCQQVPLNPTERTFEGLVKVRDGMLFCLKKVFIKCWSEMGCDICLQHGSLTC